MTTITNNSPTQELLNTMNTQNSSTSSASGTQDRFLKLLVTQLKNQDPLNPMDNAQVTSQMAQLSTVEGLDKVNSTLGSLLSSSINSQALQTAGMIGRKTLVVGDTLHLKNGTADYGIDLSNNADSVKVNITDSSGKTVRTLDLSTQKAGVLNFNWDGKDSDGNTLTDGDYKFSVAATASGNKIAADGLSSETITSISSGYSGIQVFLSSNQSVSTSDLRRLY